MKSILILIAVLTSLSNQLYSQEPTDTIWSRIYNNVLDAKITPDDEKVIVSTQNFIQVFDSQTGDLLNQFDNNHSNSKLVVSPDSKYLYSSSVKKWDLTNYELLIDSSEHYWASDIKISVDGSKLYLVSSGKGDDVVERKRIFTLNSESLGLIQSWGDLNDNRWYHYDKIDISILNDKVIAAGSYEEELSEGNSKFDYVINSHFETTLEYQDNILTDDYLIDDIELMSDQRHLLFVKNGDVFEYDLIERTTETVVEKDQHYAYKSIEFSNDNNYFFLNDWRSFRGKLFNTSNYSEVGLVDIPMSYVYDFSNSKLLFFGQSNLYCYDLEPMITGIEEIKLQDLKIFNDKIVIQVDEIIELNVFDYLGNHFLSSQLNLGNNEIYLGDLEGGCYFLTINTGQSIQTIKFIRE